MVSRIEKALQTLSPDELHLVCLAVLHGVPIRELSSAAASQDQLQSQLIGGLRKLRKALTDEGLSSAELQKTFKALHTKS